MRLIFDLEANGLLDTISQLHCLVTLDIDTGETRRFTPDKVEEGLRLLMEADLIIGHNAIKYDIPAAAKLYPWFSIDRAHVADTLVLSRLIYSDLSDRDFADKASELDRKLIGSHSLKAWGQRLGLHKGDYDGGWETFTPAMLDYNERDVAVTERLYEKLTKHEAYSAVAADLEHHVAFIVAQQERYGFTFNVEAADKLTADLMVKSAELKQKVQDAFPPWDKETWETPKRNNKNKGHIAGVPYLKTKTVVFNPGSRQQIANRLKAIYDWTPTEFTEKGQPKIDETVLAGLPYPEAKLLSEYFLVQKRIGMLSDGDNAWIKKQRNGKLHGECITNGAVTGRATHKSPNIAQVPACGAPYGKECRSLFGPSKGRVQVGIDVSGLELRMLAHFMFLYDKGQYGTEVISGDVHTANQKAAGLDTRNQAKTFIYAFLYGAGPEKIGSIVGKGAEHGRKLKQRFLRRTPALARLLEAIKEASKKRGYLRGLDQRRLTVRSQHSAPNTLLQSAGAIVCKRWMVELDRAIQERGWQDRCQQIAWVHDELQFECDPDIADDLGKVAVQSISAAGVFFKINIPLTGEYKIGTTWAETH